MQTTLETPLEIRSQIWKELTRSVHDKHHAWRTPVLSTVSKDGEVNSRTVVLRGANESENYFLIYTDARSSKVSELRNNANGSFVFWSPRLRWQLRVKVRVSIITTGSLINQLWEKVSQSAAISDYTSVLKPGSKLDGSTQSDSIHTSNEHHFAVLKADIGEIDWLELSGSGHRRARIHGASWDWLTP
jgi:pyridoxine/pyridoxamine 5'-phosphate oxidase